MKLDSLAAAVLLVTLGAGSARADDPTQVPIFLSGQARTAPGWSLDGAQAPTAAGDVLLIDYTWPITRVTAEPPRFPEYPGDWSLHEESAADGGSRLVGVHLEPPRRRVRAAPGATAEKDADPEDDGIPDLTDAQVAGLRSVVVRDWPQGAATFLARIDPATTCVWIRGGLEQALPGLPGKLRTLYVTGEIPSDLSGLARLKELRFLVLRGRAQASVDARPLAGLAALRVLELPAGAVEHADALGGLGNLRQLSLAGVSNLTSLEWLRGCVSLRRLDVSHTELADLSPVGGLPALEAIDAHLSPVRALPAGPCKALRSLRLGSSVASPEVIETFHRAHPDCVLVPGHKDILLEAIRGVDRIRIRTGGTCHRDPENEVVRDELTTPQAVRELLALLEIDDCPWGLGCMCCGGPTFEFHLGSRLLAAVSLHHNSHLRWDSGAWPGDVFLSSKAAPALAGWLARHGESEPLEAMAASRRRELAERHREERHLALLGAERLAALRADLDSADGIAQYPDVLRRFEPDRERRVLLALRLLGAAADTWSEDVTYAASYALSAEAAEIVLKAGSSARADDEAQLGFALYLLARSGSRHLPDDTLDGVVPPAALRLLAHADPRVRGLAITGLSEVRRPFAIDLLRHVLTGLRVGHDGAWGSSGAAEREGAPGQSDATETSTNVATAAASLVELGDVKSLPRIKQIATSLHGYERRRLLEKIGELEASKSAPGGR